MSRVEHELGRELGAAIEIALTLKRGMLLIARDEFARAFGDSGAVILIRDAADLCVLPVHQAAIGGHLVKRRNGAGDRAIDALEFFRLHDREAEVERPLRGRWDPSRGALMITGVFAQQT